MSRQRFHDQPAPSALVTPTVTGIRINARSASDGRKIARSLRARGVATAPVPLTGGRELDIVLGQAFGAYIDRALEEQSGGGRLEALSHVTLNTETGPVRLVIRGAPSSIGGSLRPTAPFHGAAPARHRLPCVGLAAADGSLMSPA